MIFFIIFSMNTDRLEPMDWMGTFGMRCFGRLLVDTSPQFDLECIHSIAGHFVNKFGHWTIHY